MASRVPRRELVEMALVALAGSTVITAFLLGVLGALKYFRM